MSKKKHDPTAPGTKVKIGGVEYTLLFTYGALSIAEKKLREQGHRVSLLKALDFANPSAENLEALLFAALSTNHPELTAEDVSGMLTLKNFTRVYLKIMEAYSESMTEPDPDAEENPLEPEPIES